MAVIFLLSLTFFRQMVSNSLILLGESQSKKQKLDNLTRKFNQLQNFKADVLEKQVRELEQVFPSKKPVLEIINTLNLLAIENQVSLGAVNLNPGKLEEKENMATSASELQNFKLSFMVNGEIEKISQFVKDLQQSAPLNKIKELGVGLNPQAKNISSVSLMLEVYFQPLPKALPSLEMPLSVLNAEEEETLTQLSAFKFFPLKTLPNVTTGKEDIFKREL